jgi:hypothetical protein
MKQPPITIDITHTDRCVCLKFSDATRSLHYSLYLTVAEMTVTPSSFPRAVFDLSTVVVIEPHCLTLLHFRQSECERSARNGSFATDGQIYFCDTAKLFRVLDMLHEKRIETTLDLARFRVPIVQTPRLTIAQIACHQNARGEIARTLAFFARELRKDLWEPFLDRVRRIIGQARLYGHRDEFYFDGRYPGGMGMNGGIILYGDEFGIHT